MRYFINGFKNCLQFHGRASRKEFWMYYLWSIIFSFVVYLISSSFDSGEEVSPTLLTVVLVVFAILFFPLIALSVRRLHDIGFGTIMLIPCIVLHPFSLILLAKKGEPNENQWGPIPEEDEEY